MDSNRLRFFGIGTGRAIIGVLVVVVACSCGSSSKDAKDARFDENGRVMTSIGYTSRVNDALIQPDGKIIAVGSGHDSNDKSVLAVVRYNEDGSLDASFDADGIVETVFSDRDDAALSVALDPAERIVVAGFFHLMRYNADGSLDTSFGDGGEVVTSIGEAESMAIQRDGKIVVVGDSDDTIVIARFNEDGSPDTSFGDDGRVTIAPGDQYESTRDLAIEPDGKIVVLGEVYDAEIPRFDPVLVRCNPDGSLDTAFGEDGILVTPRTERNLSRGSSHITLENRATGTYSITLKDGTEILDIFKRPEAVGIQPDGKILVVGMISGGESIDFLVMRFNPDGSLDTDFGVGGSVFTAFDDKGNWAMDVALMPDGKIVVAGRDFELARYNPDGSLDTTFDGDGKARILNPGRGADLAFAVAVKPDGTIIVAGANVSNDLLKGLVNRIVMARFGVGEK